jgi:hypothetical protein
MAYDNSSPKLPLLLFSGQRETRGSCCGRTMASLAMSCGIVQASLPNAGFSRLLVSRPLNADAVEGSYNKLRQS